MVDTSIVAMFVKLCIYGKNPASVEEMRMKPTQPTTGLELGLLTLAI